MTERLKTKRTMKMETEMENYKQQVRGEEISATLII